MQKPKKQIVIIRHNGGRLGNQLFLYINVYAFCLEMGYECLNYSFYNYRRFFDIPQSDVYMKTFDLIGNLRLYSKHKYHLPLYYLYKVFSHIYQFLKPGLVISPKDENIFLAPTAPKSKLDKKTHSLITKSKRKTIYFDGWAFKNPKGVKKYHRQITQFLKPKKEILKRVEIFLNNFKKDFLVGVHIRQGDYRTFQGGNLYFTQREVASILKNSLKKIKSEKRILFILCSDGPIEISAYENLNVVKGPGGMLEDMFTLARCKLIIGSDSTFGMFTSYYAKIPFIVFDRRLI